MLCGVSPFRRHPHSRQTPPCTSIRRGSRDGVRLSRRQGHVGCALAASHDRQVEVSETHPGTLSGIRQKHSTRKKGERTSSEAELRNSFPQKSASSERSSNDKPSIGCQSRTRYVDCFSPSATSHNKPYRSLQQSRHIAPASCDPETELSFGLLVLLKTGFC